MTVDTQTITLRSATPEDRAFLLRTFLVSLRDPIEAARGAWNEERERIQFEQQLQLAHTQVVRVGETEVGFLMSIPHPNEVELHTLCVAPEHQGRGVGSHVTREVARAAHESGRVVVLSVLKTNSRAKLFYQRLGFAVVGESEHHFRLVLGRGKGGVASVG